MSARIEFTPDAADDYRSLDGSVRKKVDKKLSVLSDNPSLGEHLGNKMEINLTGFYKVYVDNKKFHIVYRIIRDSIEIIEIWGIGKRERAEIYRLIRKRLSDRKE